MVLEALHNWMEYYTGQHTENSLVMMDGLLKFLVTRYCI